MSEELDLSTEEVEAQAAEPQSMDDTIRQTLQDIESRGNEPEAVEEPTETAEEAEQRVRDEKGRFAKKDEPQPEEVPPDEVVQEEQPVTVPPELQKLGLRKEEAEAFAKADPAVQQAFIRRSEEMHRGFEQFRGKAQFGEAMERAIAPYAGILQQYGVGADVAVQRLFGAEVALRNGTPEQKVQMLTQIARDYGIDLGQAQEVAAQMPQPNPEVYELRSQLTQMQQWIAQQNQAREWQERESLNSEITKFASDPAHTHFEEVRNEMAGLLQAGLAPDLKTAYEMAIYANPAVRARVLAEQQAKEQAQRNAVASQKAKEARAAAAVNVSRKGTLPAAKPIGTMDDTIRETAARLGLFS